VVNLLHNERVNDATSLVARRSLKCPLPKVSSRTNSSLQRVEQLDGSGGPGGGSAGSGPRERRSTNGMRLRWLAMASIAIGGAADLGSVRRAVGRKRHR
jgi:hypothetical protein